MNWLLGFWASTIGKKVVMAVTGVLLVLFLIGHMLGNLQMFLGADTMNRYAAFLKSTGELLWVARAGLLVAVVLHIVSAYQVTMRNRRARPVAYEKREPAVSTLASKTMRMGGVLIAFFIVYHLMHFTTGQLHPAFSHTGVYGNVILGFRSPWVVAFYVVAMAFLGLHLFHGVWSGFRTLGVAKPTPMPLQRKLALVVAVGVWAGFTVIPVAVLLGILS
ncbi:MAG: succinate dehydrogenase cytochrome b subunit [Gemmatimonadaceae bacterium]